MGHRGSTALSAGLVIALAATGCTARAEPAGGATVIRVDKRTALADEPVRVRIGGLGAGERITVSSDATDWKGADWEGRAVFRADSAGTVDLTRAQPLSGTYRKADGMGLFWSMVPPEGDPDEQWFHTDYPSREASFTLRISVRRADGSETAQVLTREWMREGVEMREVTLADDKVSGSLYLPRSGGPRRAPVLLLGGSDGGTADDWEAALLASRGHPTLALCYFRCPGLPRTLKDIPLEYFVKAVRLLGSQRGADPAKTAVVGVSRGSEAAQLLAQRYPELVRDAIAVVPGDRVHGSYPEGGFAWTQRGKGLEPGEEIPLDRVRGTVLAIGAGDDRLWDSLKSAESIGRKRGVSGPHRSLLHPDAGHAAGGRPYTPGGIRFVHPVEGEELDLGGTRALDAEGRAESWPEILELIARP
ncbi:acyl-CoA thioesterase/bile acid-CoA:amino acid N-acyltransferase family protein [Streptomyces sp. CAU 1734]|uniref:acyl-CoA thioesterase/bile acid-CoA:amino acid N-acyltransferase family protein n=1 Tax=Streptomyces sp. CAU 1734 TaxID=3140360 RepID=UPI003260D488